MGRHGAVTPIEGLCHHHQGAYAARARTLTNAARHPERGMKALRREAALIAAQCPSCEAAQTDPKETR